MSAPSGPCIVIFHRLASQEYRLALRRYGRRSPGAAQRFYTAVDTVVQRIAATPDQGAPFGSRFRWLRLRRFPFLLYYEVLDPSRVKVYAVAHASRRPGYWLRRRTRP